MPSINAAHTGDLGRLDPDVLLGIFEILRPRQGLRPLSLTCKWIREACMSVLFGECALVSGVLDRRKDPCFLPCSLWPHVRTLHFNRAFERPDLVRLPEEDLSLYTQDASVWLQEPVRSRLAAAQKLGQFVKEALLAMTNLHTIRFMIHEWMHFRTLHDMPVGVAAHVLEAIISVPHLRHLYMLGPLCNPEDVFLLQIAPPPTAALETFECGVPMYRPPSRTSEMDRLGIYLLLESAHGTLMSLTLPSESTPLHRMHSWHWPRLTKLYLYGERPVYEDAPPLVMTLGRMLRLRQLTLFLAEPAGSKHRPIWPTSVQASYAWPELERLEVTHPHAEDEFYAHLPTSLRRLSLRCWPRHYKHYGKFRKTMDDVRVNWTSPLLSSAEMLGLLRKSETPDLTHLELEFRADDAWDDAIFRHIGSAYSHLTVLRLHYYRSEGGADPPVKQIAHALRGLVNLRLLMLYLDFQCLPDVLAEDYGYRRRRSKEETARCNALLEVAREATMSAADVFARILAPSVEYVCFLLPLRGGSHQWRPYRVVRDGGECTAEVYYIVEWPCELYGYPVDTDE